MGYERVRRLSWRSSRLWSVRQVSLISSVERYWPWQLLVHHEAESAADRATAPLKTDKAKTSAVMRKREPVSASLRQSVVVNLPKMSKPDTVREATSRCSGRATRGGRGRRASNDQRGT
jgi:hypothetical protein